ncbi:MAG: SMC-Scp complex subunit ScpB [Acidimicrobiaceae bacterium]|nr:SMC-Scp complex subunit ScpB [Acidimicrobiaceae bacterium]
MRDELSLHQKLEAMLCVAIEPISPEELADLVDADVERIASTLNELRQEYVRDRRGFVLVELASGWVMQSSGEVAEWVTKFANRDVSHRLSSAALETLAIIAYRQPISRAQITALRGVNVDGVSRLLEQRGYIEEKGRAGGPGQPILYGTTELFLDRMGLATLGDLPPIEEFMPPLATANELADEMTMANTALAEES